MLSIFRHGPLRQRKITTGGCMWKEFSPDGNIYRLLHGPTGLRRLPLDAQPTEASTGSGKHKSTKKSKSSCNDACMKPVRKRATASKSTLKTKLSSILNGGALHSF